MLRVPQIESVHLQSETTFGIRFIVPKGEGQAGGLVSLDLGCLW